MDKRTENIAKLFKKTMEYSPKFKDVTKFLWFPKTINGKTKWLTTASWQEQFVEETDQLALDLGSFDSITWVWKPVKWL